jgi:hypothetical protein
LPGLQLPILSTVRVRAAVGQSGLQPGAFDKFATYGPALTFEGPGIQQENLGNPDLKPERATEWEFGADLGFLDNRLGIEVTYWDRTTRDALVERQFAPSGGFSQSQLDNVAELEGHGWELKLDALLVEGDNLSVGIFANGSFLREVITDMGSAPTIEVGYFRFRNTLSEGFAPGTFFGAQLIPLCSTDPIYSGGPNEGDARPCYTQGATVPFDTNLDGEPDTEAEFRAFLTSSPGISLDDSRMNPLIDDEDGDDDILDHPLGKPTPDWQGSFGAQITLWQNVHVNALFEYRTGGFRVSNLTDAFRNSHGLLGRNTRRAAEVESTLLNPASQGDAEARLAAGMAWATELKSLAPFSGLNLVEPGDFLRWRELDVTYAVPGTFADKLGFSHMSVSFTVRNLHLFSGYSGTDPEVNQVGRCGRGGETTLECNFLDSVDSFGPPLPRRFGVSVAFGF